MAIPSNATLISPEETIPFGPGESGKPAVLVNAANGHSTQIVVVPGATPRAICSVMQYPEDQTAIRLGDKVLGIDENIYPLLTPGQELYVTSQSYAGKDHA